MQSTRLWPLRSLQAEVIVSEREKRIAKPAIGPDRSTA
jgi:hypothetical protein